MIFCKRCGTYAGDASDACPKCNASLFESGHPSLVGGMIVNAAPAARGASGAMMGGGMMEPAGHGQRILARIIDSLIQGLIVGVGAAAMILLGDTLGPVGVLIILGICVFIALVAYDPYFIATKGATPGKSAMGLRVVSKDGSPVGAGQAVARWFVRTLVDGVTLLALVPLFTERHQGLHDMAVGTYVVRG